MKIIFVQDFNSAQQGFDVGQISDMPKDKAKSFIERKFARKATAADVKAAQAAKVEEPDEDDE